MHELGLCDALLKMVQGIMKEEDLVRVDQVTIEIGSLSGVVPKYMADCWEAVVDRTELQDTRLVIEELAGTAKCLDCGIEFTANPDKLSCPACGSKKLLPLSGRDLTLKEILAP